MKGGFKKNLSSTVSNKPLIPKPFSTNSPQRSSSYKDHNAEECNENDQHFLGIKGQSPNKGTKNFMSHTISATSKFSSPRKKILVEKNESSGSTILNTHMEKIPPTENGDSNVTPLSSSWRIRGTGDGNSSCPDPYSLPYDPIRNYLSPRPKFLRYKPNRRLEMILGRESESRKEEEEEIQFEIQDGSDQSCEKFDSEFLEVEESEKSEEDEEEEQENPRHCNVVLRSMFLLGILFFTISYISTNSCPISPPSLQAFSDFKETLGNPKLGYGKISETMRGLSDLCLRLGSKMVLPYFSQHDLFGGREFPASSILTHLDEEANSDFLFLNDHTQRVVSEDDSCEDRQLVTQNTEEDLVPEKDSDLLNLENVEGGQDLVAEEGNEVHNSSDFLEKDQTKGEVITKVVSETVADEGIEKEEEVEPEADKISDITNEMSDISELKGRDIEEIFEPLQVSETEFESDSPAHGSKEFGTSETEMNSLNSDKKESSWIQYMKNKSISKAVIGYSTLAIFIASMIFGYLQLKHRRAPVKESMKTFKSSSESIGVTDKCGLDFSKKEEIVDRCDSFVSASSFLYTHKDYENLYQMHPLSVEFLGEYTVGEISGPNKSSKRSLNLKPKTTVGSEVSFSQSQEKTSTRRESFSEFSAADSPSYGSFTAQEKLMRKEEVGDGEKVKDLVRTPVRRSSRIHNRVMSP